MSSTEQLWLEVERVRVNVEVNGDIQKVWVRFKASLNDALDDPGPWIETDAKAFGEKGRDIVREIDKARHDGLMVVGLLEATAVDAKTGKLKCIMIRAASRRPSER